MKKIAIFDQYLAVSETVQDMATVMMEDEWGNNEGLKMHSEGSCKISGAFNYRLFFISVCNRNFNWRINKKLSYR